jgi:uncharacterized lipoprotein YmbA
MNTGSIRAAVILTALLTVLTGCMNLVTGKSPATRYFLLEPETRAMPVPDRQVEHSGAVIGIGPVVVPPYLDRPQMVTRVSAQELAADDFNQWAEPLKANIARVMGEDLMALIGGARIRLYPWPGSTDIGYRITMNVFRFDADASGNVVLMASWRILGNDPGHPVIERRTTIETKSDGNGIDDRVEAMSRALAGLAREVADAWIESEGAAGQSEN